MPSASRCPTASCAGSCSRGWPISSTGTPRCARRSRARSSRCSTRRCRTVPSQGNGGSGEIVALGRLFYDLSARIDLKPKERMALINGSPCAAALVADVALAGQARLRARRGRLRAGGRGRPRAARGLLARTSSALWDDEHETAALRVAARAARRRRARPPGAPGRGQLPHPPARPRPGAPRAGRGRGAPRTVSLRSVTDNPVYVLPDAERPLGDVISTGGYHNARSPAAMDAIGRSCGPTCASSPSA